MIIEVTPTQYNRIQEVLAFTPRIVTTQHEDVRMFYQKFDLPHSTSPRYMDKETYNFRVGFLQEELDEFQKAHKDYNLIEAGDALIDLVYVAHGTAHIMGIPWELMWNEVQRANMSKVRATSPDQSKRGTALDVIKPEGWIPPQHHKIWDSI